MPPKKQTTDKLFSPKSTAAQLASHRTGREHVQKDPYTRRSSISYAPKPPTDIDPTDRPPKNITVPSGLTSTHSTFSPSFIEQRINEINRSIDEDKRKRNDMRPAYGREAFTGSGLSRTRAPRSGGTCARPSRVTRRK